MGITEKLSDPTVLFLLFLVLALGLVLVFRKRTPDTHVQQASQGGTITHHHDARVSVVVTVERRE